MFKTIGFLFFTLIFYSCEDNTRISSCFRNSIATVPLDLNNPQLNGVLTPTGSAKITGGMQGIILYNGATLGYKAFDRKCPKFDCNTPMSFDGQRLKCVCDDSEYSILTGEPLPQGTDACFAREYTVTRNGSSLRISN
ncbi:phosphoribosylaminoimidazole carboxylase [Polaribacter sp. ALD11]|uniref:phosphoribosylaminoimidazole carboxylase n=1 Tax=Polaribacter sp. ALD11 TaxID=2058137 RepID=UPI000C30C9AA|nr:phosphoribosylaminoimidazole carboxylase [Polaribacter sp. ALD11]AUC86209.1 phosphoribosylaminoimidazole carboxylase [Polaribacter sp. ALD11]